MSQDLIAEKMSWLDRMIIHPDNASLFTDESQLEIQKELSTRWVKENLVEWVLAQPPPQVVMYLASPEFPKFEKARGRAWAAQLSELSHDDARLFWLDKWKLPEEFFESAWENSGGEPRLLFWAAQRRKRELANKAGGVYTG